MEEQMAKKVDNGKTIATLHGVTKRSWRWPLAKRKALKAQPYCTVCGSKDKQATNLQVHHIIPFHYAVLLGRPDLELDQRNLIVLCQTEAGEPGEDHHLLVGHAGNFQSSNIDVRQDAVRFLHMTESEIKKSDHFKEDKKNRLKPWDKMTMKDKEDLKALMNQLYPLA
jgi:5-methylcytosine-specific restriction protein A